MKKYRIYIDTFSWEEGGNVRHAIEHESPHEKEDVLVDFINNHLIPLNHNEKAVSISNGHFQTIVPYEKIAQFEIQELKK